MANRTPSNQFTVGLDIGYGVTKALTDTASVLFPSVWGHAREIKFQAANLSEKYPGEQLTDDDGDWFIGDLALSQLPVAEQLRLRGRTAHHDSQGNLLRLRLAKAALGKLQPGRRHDVLHLRLSSGLPVDHMRNAAALKEALLGQHHIQTDACDFVVNVTEVYVMPQPYGSIYANTLTPTGEINTRSDFIRTGVVDVGTYTVDLALDDCGEFIDSASGSVEGGVHTAQERIAALLESEYGEKLDYRAIEQVLRTGRLRSFGKVSDFSREVDEALEPLRSATLNLMRERWQTGRGIDVIYLSGGGAVLVEQIVKAEYPQARLIEDAQLANARGYLNYAVFRASESSVTQ